jgi:hypothetical protein
MRKSLIVILGIVFALSLLTTALAKSKGGSSMGTGTHMTGTVTPGGHKGAGTGMTGKGTPGSHMGSGTGMTGTITTR